MSAQRWCSTSGASGVAVRCGGPARGRAGGRVLSWLGSSWVWFLAFAAAGAIVLAGVVPGITRASQTANVAHGAWPADAHSIARNLALRWSNKVPDTARLGAEPPGTCHRVDGQHAACSIAIVVLVSDGKGQWPWRCSASALISRAGDRLVGRRADTRCLRFPSLSSAPDPGAALGAAYALQANGDTSCLQANGGRTTCVMRYRGPNAKWCVSAASVPRNRPARSIALGAPICRQRP
jgi:hypothetical protein